MRILINESSRAGGALNPKRNFIEDLRRYAQNPNCYLHFAIHPKFGVNPRSPFDETPNGIHCYHLEDYYKQLLKAEGLAQVFPYAAGDRKYAIVFENLNPRGVLNIGQYNQNELTSKDIPKLYLLVSRMLSMDARKASTLLDPLFDAIVRSAKHNTPATPSRHLYVMTQDLAHILVSKRLKPMLSLQSLVNKWVSFHSARIQSHSSGLGDMLKAKILKVRLPTSDTNSWTKKFIDDAQEVDIPSATDDNDVKSSEYPLVSRIWANLFRALGYNGLNDPGYGLVHYAAPSQAIFFSTQSTQVVDITDLHVGTVPSVLYTPDAFVPSHMIPNLLRKPKLIKDPAVIKVLTTNMGYLAQLLGYIVDYIDKSKTEGEEDNDSEVSMTEVLKTLMRNLSLSPANLEHILTLHPYLVNYIRMTNNPLTQQIFKPALISAVKSVTNGTRKDKLLTELYSVFKKVWFVGLIKSDLAWAKLLLWGLVKINSKYQSSKDGVGMSNPAIDKLLFLLSSDLTTGDRLELSKVYRDAADI